jgi:signal transduction histidine kinase
MQCSLYHDLQIEAAVAGRWVFELGAAGLIVAGVALWRNRPRLAGVLALAAIAVSAPSYALIGQVPLFPGLYVLSLVAVPVWLRLTDTSTIWSVVLLGSLILAASWIAAWAFAPAAYDLIERTRVVAIVAIAIAGIAQASGRIVSVDGSTDPPRALDAVAALAAGAWAVAVLLLPVIPEWVGAVVAAGGVVAYLAVRDRVGGLLNRLNVAEARQRATLQALEAERSRVARDLHDVPLQELAAVIHRLDRQPGTAPETEQLRRIAGHLRNVTTSLRPPVLDDVGLGAAMAEFEARTDLGEALVRVTVEDRTGVEPGSRPPPNVELAVFRIVQEAIANAQNHAESTIIDVEGVIAPNQLRVGVKDNGRGISEKSAAVAARAGRLGLASMRERAAAIGATLSVSRAPVGKGTSVVIEWSGR